MPSLCLSLSRHSHSHHHHSQTPACSPASSSSAVGAQVAVGETDDALTWIETRTEAVGDKGLVGLEVVYDLRVHMGG
jgi:hypothetical protein